MIKLSKIASTVLLATVIASCSSVGDSFNASQKDFQQYIDTIDQYNVNESWWMLYRDRQLNNLIEIGLENNLDLAKSAILVNKALYNANLLSRDLIPRFSGELSASATRDLHRSSGFSDIYGGALNVSYTIDLWRRLSDSIDAAEWEHKATLQDLSAARLSLINSIISSYYNIAYLNDAIKVTEQSIKYYQQLNSIVQKRLRFGLADQLSEALSQQAILTAQNNLLALQNQRNVSQQTLRNLLNLKPNQSLTVAQPNILTVANIPVNLNVPISVIANRPDLKAHEYRLRSAFKNVNAMEKGWYPSVTLGGSLTSRSNQVDNAFSVPFIAGSVTINLPFLDWSTVKWNVKLSEADYEIARLNFQQGIVTALNEINSNYFAYQQSRLNFDNLDKSYRYSINISRYYKLRYEEGLSELSDWLNAINTEINSQVAMLNAKYNLIQSENAVYSAMAGYYSVK